MDIRGFGGMPGPIPKIEPIVTFSNIRKGLKIKAIKNNGFIQKGDILTIVKENESEVVIKTKEGKELTITPIEACLGFILVK